MEENLPITSADTLPPSTLLPADLTLLCPEEATVGCTAQKSIRTNSFRGRCVQIVLLQTKKLVMTLAEISL